MNTYHPSALPPATKLFLDALQAGGKLNSPTGPTVLAQAGAQMGVNPQQGMEPPPEEQQGIAAILNQAQQAGPTIANNQAAAQQQQLVDQAANQAAPAAAQMLQQQQQPQGMARGGLAAIPVQMSDFKEGGVIGYDGTDGSYVSTRNPAGMMEQAPDVATSEAQQLSSEAKEWLKANLLDRLNLDPDVPRRMAVAAQLRSGLGAISPGFFEKLTPSERESRLSQESQLQGMIQALEAGPKTKPVVDRKSDHAMAAEAIGIPASVAMAAPAIVPEVAAAAAPISTKPVPTQPTTKATPDKTSSKVSLSTSKREKGSTEPTKTDNAGIPTVQNFDDAEAQRLYKLRQMQIANKPDFQSMGLADIAAMQDRDKQSSAYRRYAAIAGARKPGIEAGSSMMAAAGQFAQAEDALANATDAAKTALAKATYAESIGDTDSMLKFQKEFNDNKVKMAELRQRMDLGVYEQQQLNKRNELANALRAEIATMRALTGGKTGNLKDPNYVANMISDNVTNQLKEMIQAPQIGMSLKNVDDYSALRDQLMAKEVAKYRLLGADLSQVISPQSTGVPAAGEVRQGYKFKGGNPADKANWEKV